MNEGMRQNECGDAGPIILFAKKFAEKEKGGGPGLPASLLPLAGNVRLT